MRRPSLILGIETSCDETAAAVVASGRRILSSVTHSQIAVHHPYGGIVPELAGREHIRHIVPVVSEALLQAKIDPSDLVSVGVAVRPGLLGALLVGVCFAKAFAWAQGIPLIEVDHLEGHICSIFLTGRRPKYPFVSLVVSGGHTSLFLLRERGIVDLLGRTRDDAAGEAFDKVSKFLGLGYPGGPVIEARAREGNPAAIPFPRARLEPGSFDFSFSGLKTAVINHVRFKLGREPDSPFPQGPYLDRQEIADITASFQEAVADVLVSKSLEACRAHGVGTLVVAGGVAANGHLRERFLANPAGIEVLFPPVGLCTDNAAMIAAAAHRHLRLGRPPGSMATDASTKSVHAR